MNYKLLDEYCNILRSFNIPCISTPIIQLSNIYVKRDDLLFMKCSKQRGISFAIYYALNVLKKDKFVLSSSGNSAAVATYITLNSPQIKELVVFLPDRIESGKLENLITKNKLNDDPEFEKDKFLAKMDVRYKNISFYFTKYPRKEVIHITKKGYVSLNTSENEYSILGFKTLGYEIYKDKQDNKYSFNEIFIPASSGATVIGLFEALKELNFMPKINIVQTTHAFALVKSFFKNITFEENHPATSIVDYVGKRRSKIFEIIQVTKGKPFIVNSIETIKARDQLKLMGIDCSFDSALTFAAFLKAGKPAQSLLIFTG